MNFELRPNSYRFSTKNKSRYTAETLIFEAGFVTRLIDSRLSVLSRRRIGPVEFLGETREAYFTDDGRVKSPVFYFFHAHCYMEVADGQTEKEFKAESQHSSG